MKSEEESGEVPRILRPPDHSQVVATAAVLIAAGAMGLLIWALASPGQLAWLTPISNVLAVDLAAWTASAGMLAWVIRTRKAGAAALPAHGSSPSGPGSEPAAGARGFQLGSHNLQVNFFEGRPPREAAVTGSVPQAPSNGEQDGGYALVEAPAGRGGPEVPRQLPAVPSDFTGRLRELGELAALCSPAGSQDVPSAPVVVISGPAGSGKSALALRMARELTAGYPDGQLYSSLRGERGPLPPGGILPGFLRALGASAEEVPRELGEQAARYRSLLAGRRVLVLLDDALDEAQVRHLLPGDGRCLVIVTSRNPMRALEGAASYPLGLLEPDEATALLTRIAGQDKIRADPAAGERIVHLCGRLPLAIRISAARLRARPDWSAEYLAGRLSGARRRLAEFRAGDLDVRASLELSYRDLGCCCSSAASTPPTGRTPRRMRSDTGPRR